MIIDNFFFINRNNVFFHFGFSTLSLFKPLNSIKNANFGLIEQNKNKTENITSQRSSTKVSA